MNALSVTPNLEALPWDDLPPSIAEATLERVGGLPGGTMEGRATVSLLLRLPDGTPIFAQTTLRLFYGAAQAIAMAHPDPEGRIPR